MKNPVLIARRKPEDHKSGAPGNWWVEYRVRYLSDEERLQRSDFLNWALEHRYLHEQDSEYCHGHDGVWKTWDYGKTPKEAAFSCMGDSWYGEAESLHPLHKAMVKENARRDKLGAREAELRAIVFEPLNSKERSFGIEEQEVNVLKDTQDWANERYQTELKKARLSKAAAKGKAPPDKIDAIRKRVMAEYEEELAKRTKEHEEAKKELAKIKEKLAVKARFQTCAETPIW